MQRWAEGRTGAQTKHKKQVWREAGTQAQAKHKMQDWLQRLLRTGC